MKQTFQSESNQKIIRLAVRFLKVIRHLKHTKYGVNVKNFDQKRILEKVAV